MAMNEYKKGYKAGVKALLEILIGGAAKGTTPRDDIYYLKAMAEIAIKKEK